MLFKFNLLVTAQVPQTNAWELGNERKKLVLINELFCWGSLNVLLT